MKPILRLRGASGDIQGMTWESDTLLRAGRVGTLEVVLDDHSVSRKHAEFRKTILGWSVRDLHSKNGTYVNGARLGEGERKLGPRDVVRLGKVALIVEIVEGDDSRSHRPAVEFNLEESVLSCADEFDPNLSAICRWRRIA